jgi:hypothetical protein
LIVDQSLTVPNGISWTYGDSISNDPENLAYTRTLEFNDSTTIPGWLNYDVSTYSFSIVSTSHTQGGNHRIAIVIEDEFNDPVKYTFALVITSNNTAPVKVKFIDSATIVNYNYLFVQFEDVHVLFTDPDGRPMTSDVKQANGNPLPLFLTYDITSNTLFGTPVIVDVGTWTLAYVAIDDIGNIGEIDFKVIVKPCYYKCISCTSDDYNQCLT